jgi:hypothetical protein
MGAIMINIVAEQEHYLLISDGKCFTLAERRAGKFYPLCRGIRHGVDLDDEGLAQLVRWSGSFSEFEARRRLTDVAGQWRDLFEHVR